jgi:NAD(P)-dependent dehydrogenase (short-subunit alcohol dehydrogenase family)
VAVVTGGTDGIGAATALALSAEGADVVIVGRSAEKAAKVMSQASTSAGGSLRAVVADVSLMKNVVRTVEELDALVDKIDILIHAVGILLPRTERTAEGIEKDFAVSYLARFAFLEEFHRRGLLTAGTRLVNISAAGPKVPSYAQLEFGSIAEVDARVGMKGHGQAQLANDLLTIQAPRRYGVVAVGYGPGSVRTQIRREVPRAVRAAMTPFFALTTRQPADVARDIVAVLSDHSLPTTEASWFDKRGRFQPAGFITSTKRQHDVLTVSIALLRRALGDVSPAP